MRKLLLSITAVFLLTGCGKDEAVKEEPTKKVEAVEKAEPKTESESVIALSEGNIKKYYTNSTRPAMNIVLKRYSRIGNTYWSNALEELQNGDTSNIQINMMQHSIQYDDLKKVVNDIPVNGLGEYKHLVVTWKDVMNQAIDKRRNASLMILEGISASTIGNSLEVALKDVADADELHDKLYEEGNRLDSGLFIR